MFQKILTFQHQHLYQNILIIIDEGQKKDNGIKL